MQKLLVSITATFFYETQCILKVLRNRNIVCLWLWKLREQRAMLFILQTKDKCRTLLTLNGGKRIRLLTYNRTVLYSRTLSVVTEYSSDLPTPTAFLAPMCSTYLVLGRRFTSFISSPAVDTKRWNEPQWGVLMGAMAPRRTTILKPLPAHK